MTENTGENISQNLNSKPPIANQIQNYNAKRTFL